MAPDTKDKNVILVVLYTLGWLFVNLCPGIAQIRALYILCHHSEYLGNSNDFDRQMAHVSLIMCTYIVGYLFVRMFLKKKYILKRIIPHLLTKRIAESQWKLIWLQ